MKSRIRISFLLLVMTIIKVNAQHPQPLKVSLFLERDTSGLLDPWYFQVEIRNTSSEDIDFLPTNIVGGIVSVSAEIKLETRNKKSLIWENSKIIHNWCHSEGYNFYKLKPNESQIYEFYCPPPHKLLEIGPNEVRVSYAYFCNDSNNSLCYSPPINVQIEKYKGQNLAAFDYLINFSNPDFIFSPVIPRGHDTSHVADVEYIVKNFPESFLADYGNINLCYYYLDKANQSILKQKNTQEILYFLRKSKKYGAQALGSQNPRILKNINAHLLQIFAFAEKAYDYDLPDEIRKEFMFPEK